jgi:hypothetical protein
MLNLSIFLGVIFYLLLKVIVAFRISSSTTRKYPTFQTAFLLLVVRLITIWKTSFFYLAVLNLFFYFTNRCWWCSYQGVYFCRKFVEYFRLIFLLHPKRFLKFFKFLFWTMIPLLLLWFQVRKYFCGRSGGFWLKVFTFFLMKQMIIQLIKDREEFIFVCRFFVVEFKDSFLQNENKITDRLIVDLLLMSSGKTRINWHYKFISNNF